MPLLNRKTRRKYGLKPIMGGGRIPKIDASIYDIRRDGITQSLLTNFMDCPVKGLYSVEGWQQRSLLERVRFGNICHTVNECLYSSKFSADPSLRPDIVEQGLNIAERELIKEGDSGEKVEKDLAKAEAVMKQYILAYPEDFSGKMWVGSELLADTVWTGYRLRGKLDGVYTDKHGGLWLLETKTKGRIPANLTQVLCRDFQNQFYLLLYENMTGRKINGVLYNIIRNPGSNPHKGESLLQYRNRLYNEVGANRPHYFKRLELFYTEEDRELFRGELLDKLAEAEGIIKDTRSIYHRETSCWRCDFLELCISGNTGPYIQKPLFNELHTAAA